MENSPGLKPWSDRRKNYSRPSGPDILTAMVMVMVIAIGSGRCANIGWESLFSDAILIVLVALTCVPNHERCRLV